ncbi:metal-binding protein [Halobacteriales archaeon QS_5_70_15]|nr:MAG: metal-binding protein [Halobacteriales archaeon QS_5_70_15]
MKKQELIHLHGLLAEVRNHYEQSIGTEIDDESYRELGVRPTSIHKSKTDHKAAVFALADGITSEMVVETEQPVPSTAD